MGERVTLELPSELASNARALAERTHRRVEDVLLEWLDRAATEVPIDELPDDQVLALAGAQIDTKELEELGALAAQQGEDALDDQGRTRLDELLRAYRRGMVRKVEALRVAYARGFRLPVPYSADAEGAPAHPRCV